MSKIKNVTLSKEKRGDSGSYFYIKEEEKKEFGIFLEKEDLLRYAKENPLDNALEGHYLSYRRQLEYTSLENIDNIYNNIKKGDTYSLFKVLNTLITVYSNDYFTNIKAVEVKNKKDFIYLKLKTRLIKEKIWALKKEKLLKHYNLDSTDYTSNLEQILGGTRCNCRIDIEFNIPKKDVNKKFGFNLKLFLETAGRIENLELEEIDFKNILMKEEAFKDFFDLKSFITVASDKYTFDKFLNTVKRKLFFN